MLRGRIERNGFTLVELLVVVGIIAVRIAVLMPALKRARQASLRLVCMSNLRQIGIYRAMYSGENGSRVWPTMYNGATWERFWFDSAEQINGACLMSIVSKNAADYAYDSKVFFCPASPAQPRVQGAPGAGIFNEHYRSGDYAGNSEISFGPAGWSSRADATSFKMNQVHHPERLTCLFDKGINQSAFLGTFQIRVDEIQTFRGWHANFGKN